MTDQLPVIKAMTGRVRRIVMDLRRHVIGALEAEQAVQKSLAAGGPVLVRSRKEGKDFMPTIGPYKLRLKAALKPLQVAAFKRASARVAAELAGGSPWKLPPEKALEFLLKRENKIVNITEDIFKDVMGKIDEGIREGQDIATITDNVRGTFTEFSASRAKTIALTETHTAYNTGRFESQKEAGVKWKEWRDSGLTNVRDSHVQANGQVVPIDEPFTVGGEALMHPGEPMGSPENVINCHCVALSSKTEEGVI